MSGPTKAQTEELLLAMAEFLLHTDPDPTYAIRGSPWDKLSAAMQRMRGNSEDEHQRMLDHFETLRLFVRTGGMDLTDFAAQFPRTWNAIVTGKPGSFDLPVQDPFDIRVGDGCYWVIEVETGNKVAKSVNKWHANNICNALNNGDNPIILPICLKCGESVSAATTAAWKGEWPICVRCWYVDLPKMAATIRL